MQIRRAVPSDIECFIATVTDAWRTTYADFLPQTYLARTIESELRAFWIGRFARTAPNQLLAVAQINNEVAAVMCAFGALSRGGMAAIESIYVKPSYQRRGIGRQLMGCAAAWCADNFDSGSLELSVVKRNILAVDFYSRLEGQIAGTSIWHPSCGGEIEQLEICWPDIRHLQELCKSEVSQSDGRS